MPAAANTSLKKRKLLLLFLLAIALVLGCIVALWLTSPTPGVTLENIHRLRDGMTTSQVEEIFGQPCYEAREVGFGMIIKFWKTDELEVEVDFRPDDQAQALGYRFISQGEVFEVVDLPIERSLFDRFRSWLGLP